MTDLADKTLRVEWGHACEGIVGATQSSVVKISVFLKRAAEGCVSCAWRRRDRCKLDDEMFNPNCHFHEWSQCSRRHILRVIRVHPRNNRLGKT